MEFEQAFENPLHIGIASMYFVDDQNLAEQTQQAQRLMFAVQHGKQGLIDGANACWFQ